MTLAERVDPHKDCRFAALTFGNVHGVYKPGNVKLRPEILKNAQDAVIEKYGTYSLLRVTTSSTHY